jgi:hypothetical protein
VTPSKWRWRKRSAPALVGAGNPVTAVDLVLCSRTKQGKFSIWLRDGRAFRHLEYSCRYG